MSEFVLAQLLVMCRGLLYLEGMLWLAIAAEERAHITD